MTVSYVSLFWGWIVVIVLPADAFFEGCRVHGELSMEWLDVWACRLGSVWFLMESLILAQDERWRRA